MRRIILKSVMVALLIMLLPFSQTQSQTLAATKSTEIVSIAKNYLEVPYQYGGTTPNGFDCSGFLVYIFKKIGIDLPRTAATQYGAGSAVAQKDLVPGDLVFFKNTYDNPGIIHSGLYIGENQFISATTSKGVKIDSLNSSYWGPKYVGAKRVLTDTQSEMMFTDVPTNHIAYDAIKTLSNDQIIHGVTTTQFAPEDTITRGQAAAIINRILKKKPKTIRSFPDVPINSWYANDIAAVKEAGVITGYPDGTFKPNAYVNRAEMAIIIQRAFQLNSNQFVIAENVYKDITDSHWAYDAIMTMHAIDFTNAFKENQFNASGKATRAVFVIAIYHSMNMIK